MVSPRVEVVYTPPTYQDYVVYYDDGGGPIYYEGGVVYHVPTTYVHYGVLVDHYRRNRDAYRVYVKKHGHKEERRPPRRGHEGPRPHR